MANLELFNQTLTDNPPDDLRIAAGKPSIVGGFNIYWSTFKAKFAQLVGATFTGAISLFKLNATLTIDAIPDPRSSNAPIGQIICNDGLILEAPTIVLKSSNPILSLPGGQIGSPVIVAGVNSLGESQLGYSSPIPVAFSQQDTHDANIVIKAANTPVSPTAWILLNLAFELTQSFDAGKGTMYFKMQLSNPTNRTGVVEFGLNVNGVWYNRDIIQNIPALDNQIYSWSVPLLQAYNATDQIALGARVISNSNDQFSLTMLASAGSPAVMRLDVLGQSSSGGGDMYKSVYDPQNKSADAFNYANFNGAMQAVNISDRELTQIAFISYPGLGKSIDLEFQTPVGVQSYLYISITGNYSNYPILGILEAGFTVAHDNAGIFYADPQRFISRAENHIKTYVNIGEYRWDPVKSKYVISITGIGGGTLSNALIVKISYLTQDVGTLSFTGVSDVYNTTIPENVVENVYSILTAKGVQQLNGKLNINAGAENLCMNLEGGGSGCLLWGSGNYKGALTFDTDKVMIAANPNVHLSFGAGGRVNDIFIDRTSAFVGIGGIITPSAALDVNGNILATDFILNSDKRLKENIKPIQAPGVENIEFFQFTFITDKDGRIRYGVIAQQVKEILPAVVSETPDGDLSVSYIDLLCAKIDSLEKRVKALENGRS